MSDAPPEQPAYGTSSAMDMPPRGPGYHARAHALTVAGGLVEAMIAKGYGGKFASDVQGQAADWTTTLADKLATWLTKEAG
jgi:hypothetical protein